MPKKGSLQVVSRAIRSSEIAMADGNLQEDDDVELHEFCDAVRDLKNRVSIHTNQLKQMVEELKAAFPSLVNSPRNLEEKIQEREVLLANPPTVCKNASATATVLEKWAVNTQEENDQNQFPQEIKDVIQEQQEQEQAPIFPGMEFRKFIGEDLNGNVCDQFFEQDSLIGFNHDLGKSKNDDHGPDEVLITCDSSEQGEHQNECKANNSSISLKGVGFEDYYFQGMSTWCMFLVCESRGTMLHLDTLEKHVKQSGRPFCAYCCGASWSCCFVSNNKYHMVIPLNDEWNKPPDDGAFDLQIHLLHGLVRCEKFGHLFCISGIGGDSKYTFGKEIMDLIDRICVFHAWPITVGIKGSESLKVCKQEEHEQIESVDATFSLFASLLDSGLQGLISIPDLILRFESSCRSVSESIRYGASERYRIVEDKLMRQKARLLQGEAASWSFLWYLFGNGNEEHSEDLFMFPTTSHLEACQFVTVNHTAQLCLRIVQWLERLASIALDLDNTVRGSYVGTYVLSSGVWHHTQRHLKRGASNLKTVHYLDFNTPTHEHNQQLPDDRKQDESLLEDVWTLSRVGRLEEVCNLCRSAGQSWRAASLCPLGGFNLFPSLEALEKNGKNRMLQAIELESGIGHQWRLWKWASYCASKKIAEQDGGKYEEAVYAAQCSNLKRFLPVCTDWESACWAMAKAWLDVQVDIEVARLQPGGMDQFRSFEEAIERSPAQVDLASQPTSGPDSWPLQVLNQQPRDIPSFLQKLHSNDTVHEADVSKPKVKENSHLENQDARFGFETEANMDEQKCDKTKDSKDENIIMPMSNGLQESNGIHDVKTSETEITVDQKEELNINKEAEHSSSVANGTVVATRTATTIWKRNDRGEGQYELVLHVQNSHTSFL